MSVNLICIVQFQASRKQIFCVDHGALEFIQPTLQATLFRRHQSALVSKVRHFHFQQPQLFKSSHNAFVFVSVVFLCRHCSQCINLRSHATLTELKTKTSAFARPIRAFTRACGAGSAGSACHKGSSNCGSNRLMYWPTDFFFFWPTGVFFFRLLFLLVHRLFLLLVHRIFLLLVHRLFLLVH